MATLHAPATIEVGAIWFPVIGFRPAIEIPPHRHDHVDPARLVPAPDADEPYSKYDLPVTLDAPAEGHGSGFVVWPADGLSAPQITAAVLAGSNVQNPHIARSFYPATPRQPWWPSWPDGPDYPCHCVEVPPVNPPMPAPVPIEAGTAALLGVAIGALFIRRIWAAAARFEDWFTAERGIADGKNGWV
jgi:hypothetical protein